MSPPKRWVGVCLYVYLKKNLCKEIILLLLCNAIPGKVNDAQRVSCLCEKKSLKKNFKVIFMSTVTLHIVNETNACRMSCSFISESLIRTAFQCLQLVVTDFLPTMPCTCLQIVVDVAGSFGLQNQELNISLTSIGLLVR